MNTTDGYGQFCPVAMAAEVLAHRWTPLVLRELLAGSCQFNEIRRGLPRIPRTTLAQRLRALEAAGVLVHGVDGGWRLTAAGEQLRPVVHAMGAWGQQWTARFDARNLDPELLMWNLRRRLDTGRLPAGRTVLRFAFHGLPAGDRRARLFWLLAQRDEVDLCLKDPGVEVDLFVTADIGAFARVWLGELAFAQALRDGAIRVVGPTRLAREFPRWLLLSPFAPLAQARQGAA